MRTEHRISRRFIALLMAAAMILASLTVISFLIPAAATDADQNVVIRDDALHFIIRHWHTGFDEEANHQGGQREDGDDINYFVLLEGYIIPKDEKDKEYDGDNYTIVLVNQGSGELVKASTLYESDNDGNIDFEKPTTPYLGKLDKRNGILEIMVKPLRDENKSSDTGYDDLENFAGFSMSAGRGAVSYVYDKYEGEGDSQTGVKGTETGIKITYSKYTHLVKGHFFYTDWMKTVPGTNDPTVFDPDSSNFKEIDTAEVYTWNTSGDGHTAGEIVKYTKDDEDFACETEADLKKKADLEGSNLEDLKAAVTLTKFYSTNEGLHTNKTLTQSDDGRLFLSDLEAWYVEGYAAQLGFILDASGGMAFPSDSPTVINVYAALLDQLRTLGVSKNSDGKYVYGGKVYDDPETLFHYLEELEAGNGHTKIVKALSEVVERTVTEEDVHGLLDKIGELNRQKNNGASYYEYPQRDQMTGYYEFVPNNGTGAYAGYRTWGLNTVAAGLNTSSEFTYDNIESKKGYFTKEVTQGTEAGDFDFSVWNTMYNGFPDRPLNFSGGSGFNVGSVTTSGGVGTTVGLLLDQTPGESFTISFSSEVNTASGTAEILYIGPLTGEKSSAEFRMTSENGAFNIYSGEETIWTAKVSGKTRVTLVYNDNGNSLAIYLDSVRSQTVDLSLSDANIVFAPFAGTYKGALFVDDVFLYNTALNGNEVRQLVTAYGDGKGINDKSSNTVDWNEVFIDDDALLLLLNPRNTVHTPLGVAAYNYYVVGPTSSFPLGYWDGTPNTATTNVSNGTPISTNQGVNLGIIYNDNGAGWYAVSHSGNLNSINNLLGEVGSAKTFFGLSTDRASDSATNEPRNVGTDKIDSAPADTNTEATYTNSQANSTRFYLDSEGNLRCFFNPSSGGKISCSYVYYLADSQYVKTEALQRVLANFTTKLAEESPSSKISAVRFSSDSYKDVKGGLDSLVLLDWTDDPVEVSKIMSQVRGDGSANLDTGYDVSAAGVKQYNYALTGATYVWTGLRAFYNTLIMDETGARRDDDDAPKFVVIFTDGADNGITSYNSSTDQITISSDTKKAVEDVKNKGYTIITVYTPDAGVTPDTEEYQKAEAFLTQIAGTKDENDGAEYFFVSTDLSELSRIFEEQILSQLTDKIEDYTVEDYIDPRFDLRNADGTVWKLKANGRVEKVKVDGTVETINVTEKDSKTNDYYTFHLAGSSTPNARDPYLLYDGDKDMYYLKWVDQTIPSSAVGSKSLLPVWNAEVYLIAKDDFIGGNAVLTGGNEEKMNWVYHPYDSVDETERNEYELKLKEEFGEEFESFTSKQKDSRVMEYAKELNLKAATWKELLPEERALVKSTYIKKSVEDTLKVSASDASSGTGDMYKEFEKTEVDGKEVNDYNKPIDEYVSKGFPRTVANVTLLPINTNDLEGVIYMGEAVSPKQMLTEIEDDYITDSYYLDYLKRYVYQRYKNKNNADTRAELNMSLFDLLIEWMEINNDNTFEKEFSVPYMYLPDIPYDMNTGKFTSTVPRNNTGGENTHQKDVLGVLTYRWEQLDPTPTNYNEPFKDYVKDNTDRVVYSLTVEFTPLREGDTLTILDQAVPGAVATTTYGVPIVAAAGEPYRARDGIFAGYIPLNGEKTTFTDDFLFDREFYVNGNRDDPSAYALIKDEAYRWDKKYKPAVVDMQLTYPDGTPEDGVPGENTESGYGNATFLNSGRTLTAFSQYTQDIVSGGIALELKVLIGELREAVKDTGGKFETAGFTVTATRSFQDTEFVESLKGKYKDDWADYGDTFEITFKFDYDSDAIAALEKDEDGYVRIYATIEGIKTTFGKNAPDLADLKKTDEATGYALLDDSAGSSYIRDLTELPIGTYTIKLSDINKGLKDVLAGKLHFASVEAVEDDDEFKSEYFDQNVLNGLHTKANGSWSGSEKRDENGKPIEGENGGVYEEGNAEITDSNINDFRAEAAASSDKTYVAFYIGTAAPEPGSSDHEPVRGKVVDNPYADASGYTNSRLGILLLSTGMTKLTIVEKDGRSNESFIYRITGTTLGDKKVDLTVSVNGDAAKGERSTTIIIPPGDYIVEEDPYWSWRYDNKATNGKNGEDWTLYPDDLKMASTSLRYRNDDPVEDHKTIIYEHERNDKVWLGGENHKDNPFNH